MFEIEDDLRRAREEKRRKKRKEKEAAAAAAGGNAAAGGDGSSGSEVQLRTHRRKHSSGSSQNRLSKSVVDVIGQKRIVRVYLDAQSFKTVSVDLTTTVEQLIRMMSKKLFKVDTSLYRIVETKNNKETMVLGMQEVVLNHMSLWPEDASYAIMFKVPHPSTPEPTSGAGTAAGSRAELLASLAPKSIIRFHLEGLDAKFKTLLVSSNHTIEFIHNALAKKCLPQDTAGFGLCVVHLDEVLDDSAPPPPNLPRVPLRANENVFELYDTAKSQGHQVKFVFKLLPPPEVKYLPPSLHPSLFGGNYSLVSLLGKGGFGQVWHVRETSTNLSYAMKVMNKEQVIDREQTDHTNLELEILEMRGKTHPYIVELKEALQTNSHLYLVMELVPGGSLFDLISRADKPLSESAARFYAAEILLALEELHKNHVAYRDMKLENILVDRDGHIRLTDFGLSHKYTDAQSIRSFSGTAIYLSPEVLNDGGHGPAVDWWGLGVLLYILLCQEPPFYAESNREMFEMIRKDEPPFWDQPHLSEHALSILKGFLTKDPDLRLGSGENGIQDIKQHPFFASIDWEQMLHKQVAPPWQPAMGETPGAQIPEHLFEESFSIVSATGARKGEGAVRIDNSHRFAGFSFVASDVSMTPVSPSAAPTTSESHAEVTSTSSAETATTTTSATSATVYELDESIVVEEAEPIIVLDEVTSEETA